MAKKTAKKQTAKKPAPRAPKARAAKARLGADIDSLRQLIRLMVHNELIEMRVEDGEVKVHFKRGAPGPRGAADETATAPVDPSGAAAPPSLAEPEQPAEPELQEIKSPMVGTFYSSASPDSDPFIAVGSTVDEDSVVCIVEAMKVMNEIKAECAGTVVEICVQNAQPVEYGQALFRVRSD